MREPRQVPTTTKKHGYTLTLIDRSIHCAVYHKTKEGTDASYFEVHRVRMAKENSKPDAMIEVIKGDERLATANEFGTYGWQYDTVGRAMDKAEEVDALVEDNKEG